MNVRSVRRMLAALLVTISLVAPPSAAVTDPGSERSAAPPVADLEIPCDGDGGAFGL